MNAACPTGSSWKRPTRGAPKRICPATIRWAKSRRWCLATAQHCSTARSSSNIWIRWRGPDASLFPAAGPDRWTALRFQALADGICDAAILRRLEGNRPEQLRSTDWMERQRAAVARSVDALEADAAKLGERFTIGSVAVLAALGYLDFRFGHEDWRPGHPALSAWFDAESKRDSFVSTAPPAA